MTTLFDGLKNYDAKLTFSGQESCFEYKLFAKDTTIIEYEDESGHRTIVIPTKRQQLIVVDLKDKKIRELKHFKSTYKVESILSLPQWDITDEIKTINNLQCQKATTFFKGRKYEVWYAIEYPTIFGPWKLIGLPGLIILAHDERNEVFFEATDIQKTDENPCQMDDAVVHISEDKFEKLIKDWQKEYEERLKSMGDRSIKFDVKFGKAAGIEILE